MKARRKKLEVARQTVRTLSTSELGGAGGGAMSGPECYPPPDGLAVKLVAPSLARTECTCPTQPTNCIKVG
jgi:hypothetical protein